MTHHEILMTHHEILMTHQNGRPLIQQLREARVSVAGLQAASWAPDQSTVTPINVSVHEHELCARDTSDSVVFANQIRVITRRLSFHSDLSKAVQIAVTMSCSMKPTTFH